MNRTFCSYLTNSYLQPPPPPKKYPVFKTNQESYLPFEITKYKRETVVRCICMTLFSYESKHKSETAVTCAQTEWTLSLALVKVGLPEKSRNIYWLICSYEHTTDDYTHVYSLHLQPAKSWQLSRLFSHTQLSSQLSRSTDWDISWETDESCFDSR
jgi:hypothetical protein